MKDSSSSLSSRSLLCGREDYNGRLSRTIKNLNLKVTLDNSETNVKAARSKVKNENIPFKHNKNEHSLDKAISNMNSFQTVKKGWKL